jgi:hypothetical protein
MTRAASDDEPAQPICDAWYRDFLRPLGLFLHEQLPPAAQAALVQLCGGAPEVERPLPSVSPLRMSTELRRKLGRGAHYNLRLLIRGDLQTGKTQLWRRLQGLPFAPQLASTRSLGAVHLDWSCERTADTIKVEAWDVVDADLTRSARDHGPGLSLSHAVAPNGEGARSPRTSAALDVWKGAHGAVCTFDPRKRWTFAYAIRQLQEAPPALPMLVRCRAPYRTHAPPPPCLMSACCALRERERCVRARPRRCARAAPCEL